MNAQTKVTADHLRKQAILYVRQSTLHQVKENRESTALQYDLKRHAQELGWNVEQTVVIDEDLGESAATATDRSGFQRLVAEVTLGRVGLVMGLNASRLARNNADWHRLLEICGLTGTLIVDEDGVFTGAHGQGRRGIESAGPMCQCIAGLAVDGAVGQATVEAVTPAALDVALQVFEELRARKAEVDRLRRAQVERAREEAELAQRQYMLARPENRLVVDTLERQWNESMARLAQAEAEYSRATKADGILELSTEVKERIGALASDFPRVWKDPRTSARDRKRMLRLLIDDVTLVRNGELIRVHIRWKGGATTSLDVPRPHNCFELVRTPAAVIEEIRVLATGQADDQIACTLNSRRYRSGTGKSFTASRVRYIRLAYGIESYCQHLQRSGGSPCLRLHARSECIPTPPGSTQKKGFCVPFVLMARICCSNRRRAHYHVLTPPKRIVVVYLTEFTHQLRNEAQYE